MSPNALIFGLRPPAERQVPVPAMMEIEVLAPIENKQSFLIYVVLL